MKKKQVLIILGAARSGSTLLAKAIGGHSRCFTLGEINRFNQEIENEQTLCGCSKLLCKCEFWESVLKDLKILFGKSDDPSDQFNVGIFKQMTRPQKIPKLISTVLFRSKYKDTSLDQEVQNTFRLYNLIFEKSGADILIDSSKGLFRALILESVCPPEIEIRFVHLTRDGRGVLNSEMKSSYRILQEDGSYKYFKGKENKNHRKAIFSWLYINTRNYTILKLLRSKKTFFIKYEDFTRQAPVWLASVFSFAGVSMETEALKLDAFENHILGGNASRLNAKRIQASDEAWKVKLNKRVLREFNITAGWLNRLIGYK